MLWCCKVFVHARVVGIFKFCSQRRLFTLLCTYQSRNTNPTTKFNLLHVNAKIIFIINHKLLETVLPNYGANIMQNDLIRFVRAFDVIMQISTLLCMYYTHYHTYSSYCDVGHSNFIAELLVFWILQFSMRLKCCIIAIVYVRSYHIATDIWWLGFIDRHMIIWWHTGTYYHNETYVQHMSTCTCLAMHVYM